jgi:septal ring factor EnvC (AmiA/AmiB activator)
MRSAIRVLLCALLAAPSLAVAEDNATDESTLFDRLNAREQILETQKSAAEKTTQKRALLAYRLLRQRELGFAANPETRLEDARTFDMALLALRRSSEETATLARELDRVRADRSTLEAALITRALAEQGNAEGAPLSGGMAGAASAANAVKRLLRPVRGTAVALPGSRRDGSTKVELRHDSLQILARLNEPVRAVAEGVVKRVEALPQGGFAVVVAHGSGLTSITTGMRDIAVRTEQAVAAGQTLGFVGRNLDGAAVVSVEIWHNRRAQDPGKLLHMRLSPSG